jgi:hypothetical protein
MTTTSIPPWVGFFESPYQTEPSFDPGTAVACPICRQQLEGEPLKTMSLMRENDERSLFFRAHKGCWKAAGAEQREIIEGSIIDGTAA